MFDVGSCLETSLLFDGACHWGFLPTAQPLLSPAYKRKRGMKPKQLNKGYIKRCDNIPHNENDGIV